VCRACGRSNAADARFCSGCGAGLAAEAAPQEARKIVTALFADVVGSTALGERLDPEDLQAVVGEGVGRMVRAAEELGGHVERVSGDGTLVLFGAPVAHEDDAERAVLAGLSALEAIEAWAGEVAERWDIQGFAVRVGIETGLAVLAPVAGGDRPGELASTGDVLNTAARLEAAAEPGSILVGPRTFRLTEPLFEWGRPRELTLKGKSGVVVAHVPRASRAGAPRRSGAPGEGTRLVGRELELEQLRRALDEVLDGAGGVVVVAGEAGLGKTRLLAELRRRLERSSSAGGEPVWLEGRCVSY
jgi:class 3 adenylate cyclase